MGSVEKKDILKVAEFLGMGYYRVKESGEFVEASPFARKLFGIPQDETDLSKHSIEKLYIFPAERKLRIDNLKKSIGTPMTHTLSIRVNGEYRLLFDQCWCQQEAGGEIFIAGLAKNIEDRAISGKMFDEFPLGLYQLDEEKRIVNFNKKSLKIFGYNKSDEGKLLGRNIVEFYVNLEEREAFSKKLEKEGHANDVLKFRNVKNEVIELECFTEHHNELKMASWGVIHDVTEQQRYFRALDKMPTGYYYIEYNQDAKKRHHGTIKQCNEKFASIMGVENKGKLIGDDVTKFYASKEDGEEYFRLLDEADKKGEPVLNHRFRIRRADNGDISYVAIDSHLVREHGKVIGREGTLRDINKQVELEEKVKTHEERLSKITADINNLIHTFMHPVLKFSGHSELFHQLGTIIYKSIRHNEPGRTNLHNLGKELAEKLKGIQASLNYLSENSENAADLKPVIEKIMNVFDYELNRAEESNILLDKAIRDAALWILEELELAGFFNGNTKIGVTGNVITGEFVEYLENILFEYLIRTAGILKGETQAMRREVEALRRYITFEEKKIYTYRRHNLKKVIEENIELFKPILAQKDIETEYQLTGDLNVMISENDIDRVICNLFHNASKYSDHGPGRFVRVKSRELQRENAVELSINSCGTPIKKDEIDNGDIFKFGYRSEFAYKMDRDGTGVGLADAKEVINEHGGEITVTSEPMRDDGDPRQYKVPYITTVTIKLPKSGKK
ncbi:MAG: PAS domain-containing sensor histidine kinase [Candidatus Aminicenantes bacterium]|nr:PAS domain-containing sensor histidine kinase [Candidatus Aminicenantes bacterium]